MGLIFQSNMHNIITKPLHLKTKQKKTFALSILCLCQGLWSCRLAPPPLTFIVAYFSHGHCRRRVVSFRLCLTQWCRDDNGPFAKNQPELVTGPWVYTETVYLFFFYLHYLILNRLTLHYRGWDMFINHQILSACLD